MPSVTLSSLIGGSGVGINPPATSVDKGSLIQSTVVTADCRGALLERLRLNGKGVICAAALNNLTAGDTKFRLVIDGRVVARVVDSFLSVTNLSVFAAQALAPVTISFNDYVSIEVETVIDSSVQMSITYIEVE
jgi:hypothetical protein